MDEVQGNQEPRVNMVSPGGEVVSIPQSQITLAAEDHGYRPASDQQVSEHFRSEKYGTTGQQVITGLEGLARGVAGPVAPAVEKILGVSPKAMRERREENPVISGGSEVAGLVAPAVASLGASAAAKIGLGAVGRAAEAIAPFTQGAILESAGQAGAKALGFEGAGALSKVGSAATRGAIETMLLQSSDETTKAITKEPMGSVGDIATRIGLSGLLGAGVGGGIGVVSPLWKATVGEKMGGLLERVQKRANGEAIGVESGIQKALDITGIDADPIIRSAISGDPELAKQFNILRESKTSPGLKAKEAIDDFYKKAEDSLLGSLGKTKDDLAELSNFSPNDAGKNIVEQLSENIKKRFEPVSKLYDEITDKFSGIAIKGERDVVADKLAQTAEQKGWTLSPSSPQFKLYNETMTELSNVKTLEDLRKFQSIIWGKAKSDPAALWDVARSINTELSDVLENSYQTYAKQKGESFLAKYDLAKASYKSERELIESLNDRLKVGKFGGASTFDHALRDMNPEDILRKLSKTNDVGLQDLLKTSFPEVAPMIQKYHLDKELKKAITHGSDGYGLRSETLFKNLDKATPELREFMLPSGAQEKMQGIRALMKALPEFKSSGTAGHLDSLWSKVPGAAMGLAAMLMGHNPAIGWVIGQSAKWLARDAPDAIRFSMLKFLGSAGKVEPEAFKVMVDYIHHAIQGQSAVNKAAGSVFKSGAEVLSRTQLPDAKDRERLDKFLRKVSLDDTSMLNSGGKTGYYLPNHGAALAQNNMQAVNYLNSLRPTESRSSPLDTLIPPTQMQKSNYESALDIAEQPLIVLDKVKDGTITPQDLQHLNNIYPGLYNSFVEKLNNSMIGHLSKEEVIPYKTKIGLSLFMSQPLDSTMTPASIMAAQPAPPAPPQQPGPPQGHRGSMKNINKMALGQATAGQNREMQKVGLAKT